VKEVNEQLVAQVVRFSEFGKESSGMQEEVVKYLLEKGILPILETLYKEAHAEARPSREDSGESKNISTTKGSGTAKSVAWMRACGHACGFGPDRLAIYMVDDSLKQAVENLGRIFRKSGVIPDISGRQMDRDNMVKLQAEKPYKHVCLVSCMQMRLARNHPTLFYCDLY